MRLKAERNKLGWSQARLAFAWVGIAYQVMESEEFKRAVRYHEGGLPDLVYVYQLAMFIILITVVGWPRPITM